MADNLVTSYLPTCRMRIKICYCLPSFDITVHVTVHVHVKPCNNNNALDSLSRFEEADAGNASLTVNRLFVGPCVMDNFSLYAF